MDKCFLKMCGNSENSCVEIVLIITAKDGVLL